MTDDRDTIHARWEPAVMDVEIQVVSADATADMNDLLSWLQRDDELSHAVRAQKALPRPGDMGGGVTELLIASITSGAALQAFARCAVSWIRYRGTHVEVKFTAEN